MRTDPHPLEPSTITSRRHDVGRRLLDRGVSADTLSLLLPEWSDTIAVVCAHR